MMDLNPNKFNRVILVGITTFQCKVCTPLEPMAITKIFAQSD